MRERPSQFTYYITTRWTDLPSQSMIIQYDNHTVALMLTQVFFLLLYCRAPTEMILRSKRVSNQEQEHRGRIPAGIYNGANEGQTNELCL